MSRRGLLLAALFCCLLLTPASAQAPKTVKTFRCGEKKVTAAPARS